MISFVQIAQLTAAATDEEADLISDELGISHATGRQVRQVWDRRIRSRCIQCGQIVRGRCERCGTVNDSEKVTEFLGAVPAETIVISRLCECGLRMSWTADQVLAARARRGFMNPKRACFDCDLNRRVEEDLRGRKKPEEVEEVEEGGEVQVKELSRKRKRKIKPVDSPALFEEVGFNNSKLQEELQALQAAQK